MINEIVNLSFLENFTGNDKQKMIKYIKMFLSLAPESIQSMYNCYQNRNWEMLKTTAHALKPQFTYMGILSLKNIILQLEEEAMLAEKNTSSIHLIDQVKEICSLAFIELDYFIQKNS